MSWDQPWSATFRASPARPAGRTTAASYRPSRSWTPSARRSRASSAWAAPSVPDQRVCFMADGFGAAATAAAAPGEEACLAALARGQAREAVAMLMDLYGRSIYGYCRHLLGDADLARDVLQTTFLQAQQDLARFAGRSSIKVWLYGIARHRCLDALKSVRRRERRFAPLEETPTDRAIGAAGETELLAGEMQQLLARCLELLEARSRAAVLLRFQEDLSYPEMASVCEERVSTLQKRVARALPVLRQCLEARME